MTTLANLSFKLYNDTSLTSAFSGTHSLTHQTDLSDNDQDFTLYFGSPETDRQLEANSNPGVDNITLTPTDQLADFQASTAYSLGDLIEPTTPNTYAYKVTTAGTSGSEPSFPTTVGSTVVSGTVTFTNIGKRHETTEIILALSEAALDTNTPGAALTIGTTLSSGAANRVDVWIRYVNAVTTVQSTEGNAMLSIDINEVVETET